MAADDDGYGDNGNANVIMMITVMMLLAVLTNIRHDAGDCSWLITFCLATSQTCPGPLAKIFGCRLVATG